MPTEPTFAQKMVAKLEKLLLANAGVASVNMDGTQVSYQDLTDQHAHWTAKVASEQGKKPTAAKITLGNF